MKIEFAKPYTFEGKEYKEVELDYDSLTGLGLMNLSAQFNKMEKDLQSRAAKAVDERYQLMVAAATSKLPQEFFEGLPAPCFVKVLNAVMSFLGNPDLATET